MNGLHGTPGWRLSRWPDDSLYAGARVRYIKTGRAGYGRFLSQSRTVGRGRSGRRASVADVLGLARSHRRSGGARHGLDCAALLPAAPSASPASQAAPPVDGLTARNGWAAWATRSRRNWYGRRRRGRPHRRDDEGSTPHGGAHRDRPGATSATRRTTPSGFLERPKPSRPSAHHPGAGDQRGGWLGGARHPGLRQGLGLRPGVHSNTRPRHHGDDDTALPVAHGASCETSARCAGDRNDRRWALRRRPDRDISTHTCALHGHCTTCRWWTDSPRPTWPTQRCCASSTTGWSTAKAGR